MDDYGTAIVELVDGRPRIVEADDTIGVAPELLANSDDDGLPVDSDGCIVLAGDPAYRYRPVRFAAHRVVVCERVR